MKTTVYIERDDVFHRLDPRAKIAGLLFLSVMPLCFNDPRFLGAMAFLVGLIALASGSGKALWSSRWLFVFTSGMAILSWSLLFPGHTLILSFGNVHLYQESVVFGTAMALRYLAVLASAEVFLVLCSPMDFYAGLILLKVPFRVAFVFSLAMQLVPSFISAGQDVIDAQAVRGLDVNRGGIIKRFRNYLALAVPLFMHALRQADLLAVALESRGFAPGRARTFFKIFRIGKRDIGLIIAMSVVLVIAVICRVKGIGVLFPGRA